MAQRAVLVLEYAPEKDAAADIAQRVAHQYSDDTQTTIIWYLDTEVPKWMNIGMADQLLAYKRDAGSTACFMTVIMCTEDEADEIYNEE